MPDLVLGERADRDVLLEQRGNPGPFGIAEPDDAFVISHRAEQLAQGGRWRPGDPHLDRGFGFAWPDTSRAAASLSRITYPPGFLKDRSSGGWSRSGSARSTMSARRTTPSLN